MQDRVYVGDLCNWSAIQSRFDLDRGEPHFVFVLRESDGTSFLELAVWSDDGHTFEIVAVVGVCRGGYERFSPPTEHGWDSIDWAMQAISPLAASHLVAFSAWVEHVLPSEEPAVIAISGPDTSVLRVVRDALALSGGKLIEAMSFGGLMRVSPSQYWALCYWAEKFPEVSIRSRKLGRRNAVAFWAAE